MKMTITEALVELKLLDKKINKGIDNVWVTAGKKKADELNGIKKSELVEGIKSNFQSLITLIENRKKIKSAIVKSNAVTELKVGEHKMTVAEAIERKNNIEYDKSMLKQFRWELSQAKAQTERQNEVVKNTIDGMLERISESDKQGMAEEQKALSDSYLKENEWGLIDPLDIQNKIDELDSEIDDFEANVDTALSLSNAITEIEI